MRWISGFPASLHRPDWNEQSLAGECHYRLQYRDVSFDRGRGEIFSFAVLTAARLHENIHHLLCVCRLNFGELQLPKPWNKKLVKHSLVEFPSVGRQDGCLDLFVFGAESSKGIFLRTSLDDVGVRLDFAFKFKNKLFKLFLLFAFGQG